MPVMPPPTTITDPVTSFFISASDSDKDDEFNHISEKRIRACQGALCLEWLLYKFWNSVLSSTIKNVGERKI
jgi:hypothetical protein